MTQGTVEAAEQALNYWRFWAVKGNFHHLFGEDESTRSSYEKALTLDRTSTEGYLPYLDFLIATNRLDEALGLAQRYLNQRVEDSTAVAAYGRLLFWAGRYESSIEHLTAALAMDPGNCLAHQAMATIRLMQGNISEIAQHIRALKILCDPHSFDQIINFLARYEGPFDLKRSVANLLALPINDASAGIAKL